MATSGAATATTTTGTTPSYLNAAAACTPAAAASSSAAAGLSSSPQQERIRKLMHPPPTSLPLTAALQLLQPKLIGQTVYLIDKEYVQNWLIWALHQHVPDDERLEERSRLRQAVRMAALQLGLALPREGMDYVDPGPIDSISLSLQGHPLLLSPLVQVMRPSQPTSTELLMMTDVASMNRGSSSNAAVRSSSKRELPKRSMSVPRMRPNKQDLLKVVVKDDQLQLGGDDNKNNNNDDNRIECLAVSESFYETLRSTLGVLCDDGFSVSFQPPGGDHALSSERLILHHQHTTSTAAEQQQQQERRASPRPIEFRRKVVRDEQKITKPKQHQHQPSLMDKLLLEERQLREPSLVASVEVHPIRLMYSFVTENNNNNNSKTLPGSSSPPQQHHHHQPMMDGFVLVSRESTALDALLALMRVAEPHKATQSVRLWSKQSYQQQQQERDEKQQRATQNGDDYELVDLESLQEKRKSKQGKAANVIDNNDNKSRMTVLEWVQRHHADDHHHHHHQQCSSKDLHILVEVRKTVNSHWPRESLELENRIQVGDFVDAQDVAGKWYEAIVRKVEDDTVTVHYMGWASRWDTCIKRRSRNTGAIEGVRNRVKPPAPLWSRTDRWRERLQVGQIVEVRDSSSIVERPKWYKGEIKKIGNPSDPVRELDGGASLEQYPVDGDPTKTEYLIVLGRTQQVLVEVEQEKTEKAGRMTSPGEGDLAAGLNPQPPFLRWVNLFGEEICRLGTHLKEDEDTDGPVTLNYEVDNDRKPVEVLKAHPTLGSGFLRESLRGSPPAPGSVGLQNLGNSCFLNTTVQCLNHIEPLTQYFLRDDYSQELNRKNPLGSGGNVAVAYASLLKKMWSGEYSILAPRLLKQTVANFAPQFDNSYQHDSQEFCQFLMDGLHEDLNRVKVKPYVEELEAFGMDDQAAAIESWRKHLLRHDSIVVDHCQGMHRSHLTCPRCGRESIKFEVYSSISLPLVTSKKRTGMKLEDCIEKFLEGEQLDERNAWYCPKCRQHVCALKMIALWTVPDILILHLKRFTFDTCMTSGNMLRSKMDDTVEFPVERLDLTKQVLGPIDEAAPPVYKLFGVSEHAGPTANSGHYTATVRNSIDGHWYRCNDSHVGRTSGEASITGGAYLLFFQRDKGLSKWGGMAKVMQELNVNPYGGLETDMEGFTKVKAKSKKKKTN